ncbi:hypothetical protein WN48_01960 [Eufriesea mexicana]|uniref:Uncharacterized protein n=1 Tax=Eufriesea mexicana TaxID=516756 RepID=A0A310SPU2_9HYME|nr:hypothetical protein WN48_01960 [Eufriesea mexicana]
MMATIRHCSRKNRDNEADEAGNVPKRCARNFADIARLVISSGDVIKQLTDALVDRRSDEPRHSSRWRRLVDRNSDYVKIWTLSRLQSR